MTVELLATLEGRRRAATRNDLAISRRIRLAREVLRMTNYELALRLGVSERTVAGWQGRRPRSLPRYERLVQIAEILNRPVSYFLEP